MSSPPWQDSKEPPEAQSDPNQPSTSYPLPGQRSYLDASADDPSFLVPSTFTGISYEVDDSPRMLDYSYDPHLSLSKYLEDVDNNAELNVPLDTLNINAPASVPSNFSYLSGPSSSNKPSVFRSSASPLDVPQFSPTECATELVPPSAPMSSESQYIPSPSDRSGSVVTEARLSTVGQPAARATLQDIQETRYESPKNHDESWIMRAFYSSSEEFNSPEDWETRKSASNEEEVHLETNESEEGDDSLVDKLFEMLERAEGSDEEQGERNDNEQDTTITNEPQPTPQATPIVSPKALSTKYQRESSPQPSTSQYPQPQIPIDYSEESFRAQAGYGPPQVSYAASSEFGPPYNEAVQTMEQPSIAPAPIPSLIYSRPSLRAANAAAGPGPSSSRVQQPATHQYFRPITTTDYLSQPPMLDESMDYSQVQSSSQSFADPWTTSIYGQAAESATYLPMEQEPTPQVQEYLPAEPTPIKNKVPPKKTTKPILSSSSPLSSDSGTTTDPELWESVSMRRSPRPEGEQTRAEPRPKGPPFEQKGPTFNKEVQPVPPPPPSSPEQVEREKPLEAMTSEELVHQFEVETDRLEEEALRQIEDYDRQEQLSELRKKMCERFKKFYPNLFGDEDEEEVTDTGTKASEEEDEDESGIPVDGKVIRNGIQLAARYLALWFPDKKERREMIPWNTLRKIKPIRLCFLDNRVGHGEYETFDIGEFVTTTGHMMFAYGDGPEALDETRLFVLDIVRQQMNMLLRRKWCEIVEKHERRVFTYSHIFSLYKKHPIRLRRLVRYLVEQNRQRHMIYRVMIDQGHRRGQEYFENRMGVNETGATEVICLRKRAPHIYYALEQQYKDQMDFLCEERRLQDCDPELAEIKMFLKRRNKYLSAEDKAILEYARRVSYCSRTGRLSSFRAHRFHEFIGFPDLQTDLIYILDFMAREIVMEVTYNAALARKHEQEESMLLRAPNPMHKPISKTKMVAESLELRHYEEGLRAMEGWRKNQDILFGAEERPVMLSYGKNPIKWESDDAYNQREAAERKEFEKEGPVLRRTVFMSSAELWEEHKKVLHGEYWDSSAEDLSKEAIVFANACAEAQRLKVELEQPPVPPKWKQHEERSAQEERVRLGKLRELNRLQEKEKHLTEQLVKLMAKNSLSDGDGADNGQRGIINGNFDLEKTRKAIYTAVRRREEQQNTQK
ncbi:unnamed protein product [Cylicocyclus nassatus]|uniref:Uncharacterized protein n=1 Tax=Cylicocyclus nassatus TaxID=53992 RepID=A0AA36GNE8_CYLNA|nr:unnamed protein product [Cylicocyclus nassatus]